MVELIGVVTLVAMGWVMAAGMANEIDAQARHTGMAGLADSSDVRMPHATRDAA